MPAASWVAWCIAGASTACVILRPLGWAEWVWAAAGAVLIVALGLLPWRDALAGVGKGLDVYLFLTGMMLLAELARKTGLFDWLAARAARSARGSPTRLFALVYGLGTVVTALLSNDATAVVLTPAVAAIARAARAEDPLPYLFTCAFIANAASFVLPISNPANLVIYGSHMPALLDWLPRYALPSAASIGATFAMLWLTQRKRLVGRLAERVAVPALSGPGTWAAVAIGVTGGVLLAASAYGVALGWPTLLAGVAGVVPLAVQSRARAGALLRDVSWGVLPLVAGLFVFVEMLAQTGVTAALSGQVQALVRQSPGLAGWTAGIVPGFASNLVNNLPAGLVAGRVVESAQVPQQVRAAVLIGIDLGPNLSVTGSLATILWLAALRREGVAVSGWTFLKVGAVVMPPALILALAAAL